MPQHGFTTLTEKPSGDLKLKTCLSLNAELGGLYKLSEKLDLYLGTYVNYGVKQSYRCKEKCGLPSQRTYNNLLASSQTDKVNLLAFGVKAGIRLRASKKPAVVYVPVC
jgi:hypothetical protein